jgi:hypothetical protein
MNETQLFSLVVSSGILDPYRLRDTSLDQLIIQASSSPDAITKGRNIHASLDGIQAMEMERIYRIRLQHLPIATELPDDQRDLVEGVRLSNQQLVNYCASNPKADIIMLILGGSQYSYTVFCGLQDKQVEVVCVMVV